MKIMSARGKSALLARWRTYLRALDWCYATVEPGSMQRERLARARTRALTRVQSLVNEHNIYSGPGNEPPHVAGGEDARSYVAAMVGWDYVPVPPSLSPEVKLFHEGLRSGQKSMRQAVWAFRASEAAVQLRDRFGLFITLTRDARQYPDGEALFRSQRGVGSPWARWMQWLYRQGAEAHIAAIEHGKNSNHHAHVMCWFRALPSAWKVDPWEVPHPEFPGSIKLACGPWHAPASVAYPIRFPGDRWGRIGFRWPWDPLTGSPRPVLPPEAVGAYVVKYLSKEERQWKHRMRATRNLGYRRLDRALSRLTAESLVALCSTQPRSRLAGIRSISTPPPASLIRERALRLLSEAGPETFSEIERKRFVKRSHSSFRDLTDSIRKGSAPWRMTPRQRRDWLSQVKHDPVVPVSSEETDAAWIEFTEDWQKIVNPDIRMQRVSAMQETR